MSHSREVKQKQI